MAGDRGKRRRRAAKSNVEHAEAWWSNSIRVPLLLSDQRSLPPDGNSTSQSQEVEATLELSGFQSPTRTIFARIFRHLNNSGSGGTIIEDSNKANTTVHSKTDSRNLWRVEDLVSTIVHEISLREGAANADSESESLETKKPRACVPSSQSLFELGSVWVLDPASADRPQNKPVWKRLLKKDDVVQMADVCEKDSLFWFDEFMTLRVHSHPSRYPMARKFGMALEKQELGDDWNPLGCSKTIRSVGSHLHGGIVYERTIEDPRSSQDPENIHATKLGFAVLNKPAGMPSHSTVDNAVENLLYQYKTFRKLEYASLPQRLDTETSGLVLIATHPYFATHFSKLLEQKSRAASKCITTASVSPLPLVSSNISIRKSYRCLVAFPKDSSATTQDYIQKTFIQTQKIVEHYVDANSRAPKFFVDAHNFNESDASIAIATSTSGRERASSDAVGSTCKWQLCKLRIRSMTILKKSCNLLSEATSTGTLEHLVCSELEIELLTGRTHQIRGQLAALGCPILGDPLYGGAGAAEKNIPSSPKSREWKDRSSLRMALQCCELAFPVVDPSVGCETRKSLVRRRKRGDPSNHPASKAGNEKDLATNPEDRQPADGSSVASSNGSPPRLEFRLDSAWWRDD
mmetsp:Transcript_9414/g.23095  ORF Transcript_9414/g.23095 Transcript_9414/m.23095 type:complete len:631 (+) Transcript_9414:195-2087(+)|eukprot:CAMPEP_0197188692 /NCGR_PEP_ID=MMETSP1423-20130617/18292_1 /TAXON_ID=476441 /ORGANISM="Pseudo-nitzschia heimii, Strain UNC1101" /LENGTH=630 /DNA_ID=CAMNT_0042640597 /DNA_START=106 /DNA_END=1998 /DNA_ORIENTATION=+